jgi:hypothetical protein
MARSEPGGNRFANAGAVFQDIVVAEPKNPPAVVAQEPIALVVLAVAAALSAVGFDDQTCVARTIGSSQSGAFLRALTFYGMNEDEDRRIVFDGIWPMIDGRMLWLNERLAQPTVLLTSGAA